MQKYIDHDHVEEVPSTEIVLLRKNNAWWIPVFHVPPSPPPQKKRKGRIVFDNSAKYHGTCLNDQLLPSPNVINKLRSVLMGFRNGYISFSADIECMFHNFRLSESEKGLHVLLLVP